ncbi:HK97 family phage prohead protease [Alkalihalophilus marmarensis]|uniref:Peptidase U35 n=1 Tax=Alkalihalophilus marmarensis DSM 21297 TaxID=1188261 RepID=U6ST56_9BACI|nr:HK97 family phage prohead protease [Alkalihalophilus marmarensis]ERN54100.1 peptidase U35 [Alkalihalophilus marmarensis DSM 21297]
MNKKEIRTLNSEIEIRSSSDDESQKIVGYALRFDSKSEDLGGFVEVIKRDALNNADMSDVRALVNHDADKVLGRSTSGTLKLEVDDFGLKYIIDPPNTSYARDLIESMKRGDINQSSFAFIIDYENDGEEWDYNDDRDVYVRTIKRFKKISDVSVVTYPAYAATESVVSKRGLDDYKNELHNKLKQKQIAIELELI